MPDAVQTGTAEVAPPSPPATPPAEPESKPLAPLVLAALGIVFGDIGTSPLYAFRESLHHLRGGALLSADILGVLSLIFWSLVVVVSIKYLGFVMRADNRGEGGILALMALIRPTPSKPAARRHALVVLGLFGAALLYGDGMIAPAISVLSAVEGLEIATPALSPYVVPITIALLVVLFVIQSHGTARIGALFGPVTLIWFVAIASLGVAALVRQPSALAALNPVYAGRFFAEHGAHSLVILGSVFLVVTGAEALYADMGHLGKRPIRVAWFVLVFPALLLNYFGQGALLLADSKGIENPFFHLVPRWGLYPMVVLATAATIIASQAVISGAFSLTRQAIQFGYFPRVSIQHTSADEIGQIYVPAVNWFLLVAAITLVLAFGTSTRLAAAYGVAVTTTMLVTTMLAAVVMRRLWRWPVAVAALLAVLFLTVDVAFLAGNVLKIPAGGWVPLAIGLAGYVIMSTWRRGRELLAERLREISIPFDQLVARLRDAPPLEAKGTAVFLTSSSEGAPTTLLQNLRHNQVLHERVVLLTIVTEEVPRIPASQRVEIRSLGDQFTRVIARYGFMQSPHVPAILHYCGLKGLRIEIDDTTFFIGRENLLATERPGMPLWREKLFALISRNAIGATRAFRIPTDRVIELGAQIEL